MYPPFRISKSSNLTKNLKNTMIKSPHLFIYKSQFNSDFSIFHRISSIIILVIFLFYALIFKFFFWFEFNFFSSLNFSFLEYAFFSLPIFFIIFGAFHFLNGISYSLPDFTFKNSSSDLNLENLTYYFLWTYVLTGFFMLFLYSLFFIDESYFILVLLNYLYVFYQDEIHDFFTKVSNIKTYLSKTKFKN